MPEPNPYQSPVDTQFAADEAEPVTHGRRIYVWWTIVFLANMIVPLLFAWGMTDEHGRLGLAIAAGALWAGGLWLCSFNRNFAKPLIVGGIGVGATQFFPILQMFAGMFGVGVASTLLRITQDFSAIANELHGFLATFLTGSALLVVAAGTGFLIAVMIPPRRWRWLD